jgi:hypothetical protein
MRNYAILPTVLVLCGLVTTPASGQTTVSTSSDSSASASAQQTTPASTASDPFKSMTFNVTFEGDYQYNWNRPVGRVNVLRAYDTRANSFSIQQAALVIESAPDRKENRPFGLRLDLQFGQATDTVQGSPANEARPETYRNIWQAYGSYVFPGSHAVRLDFGKFASSLGFETNYAKDNNNFSRAYLFNFLPFYHSGLRVAVPVNDRLTLTYMLTNGIQQTEDFNEFKSNHVMAVVTPVKNVSWTINYYAGQEQPDGGLPGGPNGWFRVFDTYVTYAPTDKASFGFDVNRTTNQLNSGDPTAALIGTGVYARYQVRPDDAVALRYEFLNDDGLFGGIAQNLQEVTFTLEHKVADGFVARGEFRRDWSDTGFFPGRAPTDPLKTGQNTLLVGLVWWVGGKQGAW